MASPNSSIHFRLRYSLLFSLLSTFSCVLYSSPAAQDSTVRRDAYDVLRDLVGINLTSSDTLTKREGVLYVAALPAIGYSLTTQFAATFDANGAIYTDTIGTVNLSTFNIDPTYTLRHQFLLPFQMNIWTSRNGYNIIGDWKFFKYPEKTFGLGGDTKKSSGEELDYRYILVRQTILKRMTADVYAGIGYDLDAHWDIAEGGLPGVPMTDFDRYGKSSSSLSSGWTLNISYDTRENPINPSGGSYATVIFRDNTKALRSDGNWQSAILDLRTYLHPSAGSANVLALWSYDWFVLGGTPPYLDLPATSWDEYANQGRGYIQSRFRGRNLLSFESEYRFGITSDGLFGGVLFANAQSISNWPNDRFTILHPGLGAGLRVKLNKHSDTNVALDYAWGLEGSQGVFVNIGEVF